MRRPPRRPAQPAGGAQARSWHGAGTEPARSQHGASTGPARGQHGGRRGRVAGPAAAGAASLKGLRQQPCWCVACAARKHSRRDYQKRSPARPIGPKGRAGEVGPGLPGADQATDCRVTQRRRPSPARASGSISSLNRAAPAGPEVTCQARAARRQQDRPGPRRRRPRCPRRNPQSSGRRRRRRPRRGGRRSSPSGRPAPQRR